METPIAKVKLYIRVCVCVYECVCYTRTAIIRIALHSDIVLHTAMFFEKCGDDKEGKLSQIKPEPSMMYKIKT